MADDAQPIRAIRKHRDRELSTEPQITDIAERMVALKRRTAAATRPKERSDRAQVRSPLSSQASPPRRGLPTPHPTSPQVAPQVIVSRPDATEVEETSRRRKPQTLSPRANQARPQPNHAKLYNPDTDTFPIRRTTEPETISDTGSSSYAPRSNHQNREASSHGRLFDHKKDDPVRFHALARPPANNGGIKPPIPTPKSSGEYVSASSTSSYAHSITSSSFTLSSTTDGSSASSAVFDQARKQESGSSAFAIQLKKLYREISNLELKLIKEIEMRDPDEGRITLKRPNEAVNGEIDDAEKERWSKYTIFHIELAEKIHTLLQWTLAPNVPASLRNIPTKYNIIIRLWTNAFYKPLETLRRWSFKSVVALEHLQDFIIYSYKFYSMLLEDRMLDLFKSGWLEALGDLARYRMAIAAMTTPNNVPGGQFAPISQEALSNQEAEQPPARIDDSPGPSVGVAAARAFELEPEKERWRCIAREWYAMGLADTPNNGKLHHHLGLLSREGEGEELRAVYHFVKSLVTLHPFHLSRESIQPMWSLQAQTRRAAPDARASDLFILMQGMLFTNIQLDDFVPTLARFLERLQLEGAQEREWMMMAVINIVALAEFGKPTGVLKRTGGIGPGLSKDMPTAIQAAAANARVQMMVKKLDEMEVEEDAESRNDYKSMEKSDEDTSKNSEAMNVSPLLQPGVIPIMDDTAPPMSFKYAQQLTFSMLSYTLRNPRGKTTAHGTSVNPYITIMLTFLCTVLKNPTIQAVLERAIPWDDLALFCQSIPRRSLQQTEGGVRLTSGSSPLPEDWCLRGMEWSGRRVYERGFWKSTTDEKYMEIQVLSENDNPQHDGIIEDELDDEETNRSENGEIGQRWVRIARAAVGIAKCVAGFEWKGSKNWRVSGVLQEKVEQWKEEDRLEREEEERRRTRRTWVEEGDSMDIDEEDDGIEDEMFSDSSSDDEDSVEVKALKSRRRQLLQEMSSAQRVRRASHHSPRRPKPRGPRMSNTPTRPVLKIVPGYSVLVVDTNILLSDLSKFSILVESLKWTVVVPLAVITELDGLATAESRLSVDASAAVSYIVSHLRSHSMSLKVQTSKGNYLSTLSIRSEIIEFSNDSWERSMDDLILRAAIWQDDHWVDRSALLGTKEQDTRGAAKVVLLSFDRNLRLKARGRQLDAADEKDMTTILEV